MAKQPLIASIFNTTSHESPTPQSFPFPLPRLLDSAQVYIKRPTHRTNHNNPRQFTEGKGYRDTPPSSTYKHTLTPHPFAHFILLLSHLHATFTMALSYTETSGDLVFTPDEEGATPVIYNNGDMAFS